MSEENGQPYFEDEVTLVGVEELEPFDENPRTMSREAKKRLRRSLKDHGMPAPLLARADDLLLISGHQRLEQAKALGWEEVPVRLGHNLTDAKAAALNIVLNNPQAQGEFDYERLGGVLELIDSEGLELTETGFDDGELEKLLSFGEDGGPSEEEREEADRTLAEQFVVPPFTILDARKGYWLRRKRAWLALGIQSELGRDEGLIAEPSARSAYDKTVVGEDVFGNFVYEKNWGATSIFDPVLCELAYRWFCPPQGRVLDPFAGGSVRGIVAGRLGHFYEGIELSGKQVQANRAQARSILGEAEEVEELSFVDDPLELTPVQQKEGPVWLKRDDLFQFAGARGCKARAAQAILEGEQGATTAGNRRSPMMSRVARAAEAVGIPCRVHCADSKKLARQEQDAEAHGAEVVKHKVPYLNALCAKARKDAEGRGWRYVELGMASEEYVELTRRQAANVPEEAERLVCCVGSGMALSAILHGLDDAGRSELPVLGVMVGMSPEDWLEEWAPEGWRERVELVHCGKPFEEAAERTVWWGVRLDPHYEAKAAAYVEPGDLFWVSACRSVWEIQQEDTPQAFLEAEEEPEEAEEEEPAEELPKWQKGYPMHVLEPIADVFREHDEGLVLGAFTGVKERDVATWLEEGKLSVLLEEGEPVAAAVFQEPKVAVPVNDFTGERRATTQAGELQVKRLACRQGYSRALFELLKKEGLGRTAWVEYWREHPVDALLAEEWGLQDLAVKIPASSELRPVGVPRSAEATVESQLAERDRACMVRLPVELDTEPLAEAIRERLGEEWVQHYSSYNEGDTWSALALRGFGGQADFIAKPAEMSRKWKKENPEKLEWEPRDTELFELLPEAREVVDAVPGEKERVRIMRLEPGGGSLGRHADITDRDAGTKPGEKLMRVHIPVATNPEVTFEMWDLEGRVHRQNMEQSSCFYFDMRKPHRAWNDGETERVHLIMDVWSNPELLELLEAGEESPVWEEPPEAESLEGPPLEELQRRQSFPQVKGQAEAVEAAAQRSAAESEEEAEAAAKQLLSGLPEESVRPSWTHGDSLEELPELEDESFDFLFTCPPYFDLEVYTDDPRDISNMSWERFQATYQEILELASLKVRRHRFACIVVGDVRDEGGFYRRLVDLTNRIMGRQGWELYNEAVLVPRFGSLAIRAGRMFRASRKLGKAHQNVLVYYRGDPARISEELGPAELDEEELERLV